MVETKVIMGMPITLEVVDKNVGQKHFDKIFSYFVSIDKRFSTYKKNSEISKINRGTIEKSEYSSLMNEVLTKCEETKNLTDGYFDINHKGKIDPSGLVKGWAIYNASLILKGMGLNNFYINAGGDIQVSGLTKQKKRWKIGVRNPFNRAENIKIISVTNLGVATSGTAIRGNHIYNPLTNSSKGYDIVSLTVIGPNIYEADRFATAAFAMGDKGITFLQKKGFESYAVYKNGTAKLTPGFEKYVL